MWDRDTPAEKTRHGRLEADSGQAVSWGIGRMQKAVGRRSREMVQHWTRKAAKGPPIKGSRSIQLAAVAAAASRGGEGAAAASSQPAAACRHQRQRRRRRRAAAQDREPLCLCSVSVVGLPVTSDALELLKAVRSDRFIDDTSKALTQKTSLAVTRRLAYRARASRPRRVLACPVLA